MVRSLIAGTGARTKRVIRTSAGQARGCQHRQKKKSFSKRKSTRAAFSFLSLLHQLTQTFILTPNQKNFRSARASDSQCTIAFVHVFCSRPYGLPEKQHQKKLKIPPKNPHPFFSPSPKKIKKPPKSSCPFFQTTRFLLSVPSFDPTSPVLYPPITADRPTSTLKRLLL